MFLEPSGAINALVSVRGQVKYPKDTKRFNHTFLLTADPTKGGSHYVVANEVFRFV